MPDGDAIYGARAGAEPRASDVLAPATRSGLTTTGSSLTSSTANREAIASVSDTASTSAGPPAASRRGRWLLASGLTVAAAAAAVAVIVRGHGSNTASSPIAVASPPVAVTAPVATPHEQPAARTTVRPSKITASSTHKLDKDYTYVAQNLIDGDVTTSWQPTSDAKLPLSVRLDFANDVTVRSIKIANGFQITDRYYGDEFNNNARVAKARLQFSDGSELPIHFDAGTRGFVEFDLANKRTRSIILIVDAIHEGTLFRKDLAISEIAVDASEAN